MYPVNAAAVYPYESKSHGNLSFKAGDIVTLIDARYVHTSVQKVIFVRILFFSKSCVSYRSRRQLLTYMYRYTKLYIFLGVLLALVSHFDYSVYDSNSYYCWVLKIVTSKDSVCYDVLNLIN